ncbi:MAG TPA: hypothetical protein VLL72_04985 [Kiloniellales bacterium]|nr:hypothetical protein [Kiloniellales bacterium]
MRALAAWLIVLGLLAADLGLASDLFRVYAQGARGLPAISPTGGAAAPGAADALPEPVAFDLPPLGTFVAAVERPLFSPARRPPEPGVEPVETPSPAGLDFELVGVVITGEQRIAVLLPRERRAETLRWSTG